MPSLMLTNQKRILGYYSSLILEPPMDSSTICYLETDENPFTTESLIIV